MWRIYVPAGSYLNTGGVLKGKSMLNGNGETSVVGPGIEINVVKTK